MKTLFALTALVLVLTSGTAGWSQRKAAGTKPAQARTASPSPRGPVYQLDLKIGEGGKLSMGVSSPYSATGEIDPLDLKWFITDLPSGGDRFNTPNTTFPKVYVQASPNITMLDLWNPITLFRLDRTDITVIAPGDTMLTIPRTTKIDPIRPWPNPLLLFVTIDEAGKLSLNNEDQGTLSNTKPLRERLELVFKEREVNGVFHEGTNEVETAVTIVMPMSERKFSDLITIADVVKKAGSKWISLVMENMYQVDERKLILDPDSASPLDLPPIPAKPIERLSIPKKKKPSF